MNSAMNSAPRGRTPVALLAAGLAACLLTGCGSVGPDYQPPERPMPAAWSDGAAHGTDHTPQTDLSQWWTVLHDPVLDRLVLTALTNNPDRRLAALKIREARILLGQAESAWGPTLNASGSYTHSLPSRTTAGSSGMTHPRDLYQAGFDANWELDLFGGVRRGVEAAEADMRAIELDAHSVQVTLVAEVARNYVRLRELQAQTAITENNLKSQTATADLIRARIKAGLATELDLTRITALVSTTRAQLPALSLLRRQAIHRIEVLLGADPGSRAAELEPPAPVPTPPAAVEVGLPSELLRRRPDIARAERAIASMSARIGVATADLYPRFSINGNLGLQSAQFSDLGRTTASQYWSFGPSFRWPIFNWGRIRAAIDAAGVREEQALVLYEKTILGALEEVDNALIAYDREQARRKDLQEAVDANKRAVDLATELYGKGLTSFIDVLSAQQAQYQAESSLVANEAAITADAVALYKAVGGGWAPAEYGETPDLKSEPATAPAPVPVPDPTLDSMLSPPAP